MRVLPIAALSFFLAACASQPAAPPAPAIVTAPASVPETPPVDDGPVKTVQDAWKYGYRVVNNDGATLYCREQLKTGSHMRKETICLTEEELEIARDASRRNLEQMQQQLPPPHGT